ncbi:hypothetical protein NHX12_014571 [Muraenolepis orangiensis]|uniref:Uncharacterized protein n=1 Tax=Muraenolepis orangiensis TaxID=630683 RepID=A0A9Q0DBN3_9TELE|nr:hypothetical protein NHX12_014571 [Muraenolepis orangiensis]
MVLCLPRHSGEEGRRTWGAKRIGLRPGDEQREGKRKTTVLALQRRHDALSLHRGPHAASKRASEKAQLSSSGEPGNPFFVSDD